MTMHNTASAIRGTPTITDVPASRYAHSGVSGGRANDPVDEHTLTAKYCARVNPLHWLTSSSFDVATMLQATMNPQAICTTIVINYAALY
jgi:hypothetical protein